MQKRNIATKSVAVAVAFSMAFSMSASTNANAAKKKPKLNQSKLTLEEGETATLKVVKNKIKISKVTWKSTDTTVATVKKGVVTALTAGKATVKATFKVKGAKKKTTLKCKVTVTGAPMLAGGWTAAEDPTVTPELKALVEEFVAQSNNANATRSLSVTPYALLATQVVNGTGYRVLCRVDLGKDANGKDISSFSIVQLFADTKGTLYKEGSGLLAYMDEFASDMVGLPSAASGAAIIGGFTQFDDPVIPATYKAAFEEFYAQKGIQFPYKPIARVAYRTSTGKTEVSLVCEKELTSSGNVGTDENVGYFMIKVELDMTNTHIASSSMLFPISFVATNYDVCVNNLPAVEVETQAAWIRSYIISAGTGDTTALTKLAEKISYPVMIDGKSYKSQDELLPLFATQKISDAFVLAMRKTTCMQMFANSEGIMLGEGDCTLWINQDATDKTQMKITSINGLFSAK